MEAENVEDEDAFKRQEKMYYRMHTPIRPVGKKEIGTIKVNYSSITTTSHTVSNYLGNILFSVFDFFGGGVGFLLNSCLANIIIKITSAPVSEQ